MPAGLEIYDGMPAKVLPLILKKPAYIQELKERGIRWLASDVKAWKGQTAFEINMFIVTNVHFRQ